MAANREVHGEIQQGGVMRKVIVAIAAAVALSGCVSGPKQSVSTGGGSGSGDVAAELKQLDSLVAKGDADAEYRLGLMYSHGKGVPKDVAKALVLYRASAAQGNADGENALGVSYYLGEGVSKNFDQANSLFRQAAAQGNAKG